jgi:hypothetical protein
MRLEETLAPRSTIADAAPAAAVNGSVDAVDAGSPEDDGLDEELLADGFDEELLDDDTEPADDDDLVLSGKE